MCIRDSSLPVAFGGLGLRGAVRHRSAAYISSLSASQPLLKIMRGRASPKQEQGDLEIPKLKAPQAGALVGVELQPDLPFAPSLDDLNSQLRASLQLEQALEMLQQELSEMVDGEARVALLESTTSHREQASLRCLARKGSGDWLTTLPSKALGIHLRRQEFILAGCYHLGTLVYKTTGLCPARWCRAQADPMAMMCIISRFEI